MFSEAKCCLESNEDQLPMTGKGCSSPLGKLFTFVKTRSCDIKKSLPAFLFFGFCTFPPLSPLTSVEHLHRNAYGQLEICFGS